VARALRAFLHRVQLRLRQASSYREPLDTSRNLATQLVDGGLVQDLYLTTSPRPGGAPGTPFYPRPLHTRTVVRKHGTGLDVGVTFEHLEIESTRLETRVVLPTQRTYS